VWIWSSRSFRKPAGSTLSPRASDGAQQLRRREPRVDQQDHRPLFSDPVDQGPAEGGLPRSDVAHQQRQLLLVHRELQPGQRLAMLPRLVEEGRIGRLAEGAGAETEELFEHE
jgi:hypothetical protein